MALLWTRSEIQTKLEQVFSPEQTGSLVEVLDNIRQAELERAADTRDLKYGLIDLTSGVKGLTAGQAKLVAAQQRTDKAVMDLTKEVKSLAVAQVELTAAQQRTDETVMDLTKEVKSLAVAQVKLTAAQQRTDETVAELARVVQVGFTNLRQEVGSLANRFGFDLEEFVAALLPSYVERHASITDLTLERRYFELSDGRQEEVDLVGIGQRDGQPVTVLAECRTTIGGGEMRRLAAKLESIAATLTGREVLKIVVAMNLHPTGDKAARETGIWAVPYSRINRER